MKILLIAPVHNEKAFLQQKGKFPFLIEQGQQGWVDAIEELGHAVAVFHYTDSVLVPNTIRIPLMEFFSKTAPRLQARIQRAMNQLYNYSPENVAKNKKLYEYAQLIKPDFIILSGGWSGVFPDVLKKIKREFHCSLYLFSGVDPLLASPKAEKELIKDDVIDHIYINDAGFVALWKKLGAKNVSVLPVSSIDPKIQRKVSVTPKELEEFGCDICFVGTLTEKRQAFLVQLTEFGMKIWGKIPFDTPLDNRLKNFYQGQASGEKMVKIYNVAKIVLNFHTEMIAGGNMRTFEIIGSGGFQLVDKVNPKWFTDKRDLVIYKDVDDLKSKIMYYLKHEKERKQIAENGYKRGRAEHTYAKRFETVFPKL